jgi:hypothetical protein
MELPPLGTHYNNATMTQPEPDLNPTPTYPVAYFLCDGVTDAKTLKVNAFSITVFAFWCRHDDLATPFDILSCLLRD